ncbi:ATPase, T2SS/T4P/T4SS family [Enterococcus sp. HY326]|uniref:ATPase, T2SS/T4P/T4SS family n=1 Tax=Enterococcus sp. HY326 TaxID=2971265 RepID=UPI00223F1BC7|nr:ATPase, T2SS/T4P/T4SS family [Enterococcus sp. HY326]
MDIAKFSGDLIRLALEHGWQDISFYPEENHYKITYRKANHSGLFKKVSFADGCKIIGRFKYLGEMDVGEDRRGQLGSFSYKLEGCQQRLRLTTVGDYRQRESLAIRLLFQRGVQVSQYAPKKLPHILKEAICERGLYLFCGPVGSGKTTLMYEIASQFKGQVITIEDPVEIEEPLFLQLQINQKIDQDYDALIELTLRHHPDLLIIGEIRNRLTAQAAIRAALTGHFVFATLHARSLANITTRMNELSQNPFDLKECLQGSVYQEMFLKQGEPTVVGGYQFYKQQQMILDYPFEKALAAYDKEWKNGKKKA